MPNTLPKILIFVVIVTAFIGQAMAVSISLPCDSLYETHSSEKSSQTFAQTDANLAEVNKPSSSEEDDCCDIDCCDLGCLCLSSGCSSAKYLNTGLGEMVTLVSKEAALSPQTKQTQFITNPLYRPPIFTS